MRPGLACQAAILCSVSVLWLCFALACFAGWLACRAIRYRHSAPHPLPAAVELPPACLCSYNERATHTLALPRNQTSRARYTRTRICEVLGHNYTKRYFVLACVCVVLVLRAVDWPVWALWLAFTLCIWYSKGKSCTTYAEPASSQQPATSSQRLEF